MASQFKLNFSGLSWGNPDKSAIGIVVGDHKGVFIATKSSSILPSTKNKDEALALFNGLIVANL